VLNRNWEFPTFSSECPICGGKDCCVRIGYYYRYALSLELGVILNLPIARYLCRRKRKPKLPDRTFSLLPDCLIPYVRPTIPTLMQVIGNKLVKNKTDIDIVSEFYHRIYDTSLNITAATISTYCELFEQTAQKIKTFLRMREKDHDEQFMYHTPQDVFLFLNNFNDTHYGGGPISCSRWYYDCLGGFRTNSYFLFGTASQFR
jgi:hypothetical protein